MKSPMLIHLNSSRCPQGHRNAWLRRIAAVVLAVLWSLSCTDCLAASGDNAATVLFDRDAVGRSDPNAYFLTYLDSLIYPEGLVQEAKIKPEAGLMKRLHTDPEHFKQLFARQTRHLFYDPAKPESAQNRPPEYEFITFDDRQGYDPEAMVISTPTTVFVVFRGTDRVGRANGEGYQWNEWIKTDFDPVMTPFGDGVRGQVHKGFLNSLSNIKLRIAKQIQQVGGSSKKVWITGHSLGAAHAQLFAVYLAKAHRITAQGVYAVAAPQVGDDTFVSEANGLFAAGNRWQRFEFITDPITMLGPYVLGYRRAGVRNYYDSLHVYRFDTPERSPLEAMSVFHGIAGAGASAIGDGLASTNRFRIDLAGGPFCYHHFEWYLNAAHQQLTKVERAKAPKPLSCPDQFDEACDLVTYARGLWNDPVRQAAAMVKTAGQQVTEAVNDIQYSLNSVMRSVAGDAVPEGSYYIRNVRGGNFLNWHGPLKDGSKVDLWEIGRSTKNNRFQIQRDGAAGYVIRSQEDGRNLFVECDADELFETSTPIQMWQANGALGSHFPNQKWVFYKISGNRYLIVNYANRKALDARDKDTAGNGTGVATRRPADHDSSQVWILEKAS